MPRTYVVFIVMCIFITCQTCWAQLNPSQEKRLHNLEVKEQAWEEWERSKPEQKENLEGTGTVEKAFREGEPEKVSPAEGPLANGNPGRYQAVRMDNNAIFILDTREGHLWVWVIQPDREGHSSEFLFYQGQVIPGSNMGDLIDRTYPKSSGKSSFAP